MHHLCSLIPADLAREGDDVARLPGATECLCAQRPAEAALLELPVYHGHLLGAVEHEVHDCEAHRDRVCYLEEDLNLRSIYSYHQEHNKQRGDTQHPCQGELVRGVLAATAAPFCWLHVCRVRGAACPRPLAALARALSFRHRAEAQSTHPRPHPLASDGHGSLGTPFFEDPALLLQPAVVRQRQGAAQFYPNLGQTCLLTDQPLRCLADRCCGRPSRSLVR